MLEIGLGVILFTAIIVCLAVLILAARSMLVASGEVRITVNGERTLVSPIGERLLDVLAAADILLPSACGGRGTCGQCRAAVLDGGGAVLPTEAALLTKREVDKGTRLACQVVVKGEMAVRVPEEAFGVGRWTCRVRTNVNIATLIKELVLELPEGESVDLRAGSYVQIECPPYRAKYSDFDIGAGFHDEWDRFDLWHYEAGTAMPTTRAYSVANAAEEKSLIVLLIRVAIPPPGAPTSVPPGVVSSYLFSLKPGDEVSVSGPFGHFFATASEREMVFVGGGVGMAPMRAHIFEQLKHQKTRRKISFWYGARNRRELLYPDEFERLQNEHENFEWHVALSDPRPEDDWRGETGFIHDVLHDHYLEDHPMPEECEYYLCGPPLMIKAVRGMLDNLGVDPENIFFDDFGG